MTARVSTKRRSLSKRLRFAILRRDGFTCQYCGRKAPDVALDVDHVRPLAFAGSDHPSNLVTACTDCNSGKGPILETAHGAVVPKRASRSELPMGLPSVFRLDSWDIDGHPVVLHIHYSEMTGDDWHQVTSDLEAKVHITARQADFCRHMAERLSGRPMPTTLEGLIRLPMPLEGMAQS